MIAGKCVLPSQEAEKLEKLKQDIKEHPEKHQQGKDGKK